MPLPRSNARLWLTAALLLATSAAGAQHRHHGEAGQEPESRAERQLARAGAALQAAGNHAEAIRAFQAAQAISARRRYQALIALNEAALDHWGAAYRGLDESLRANDDPWIGRNETLLRAELARVRQHVAWLHLTGAPEGATVRIEGLAVGTLPMSQDPLLPVNQPVRVEVSAENFIPQQRTINPRGSETVAVLVELAPSLAHVRLSGLPAGTQVSVDDGAAVPADEPLQVPRGDHRLTFEAEGFKALAVDVTLRAGETRELTVRLEALPSAEGAPPPRTAAVRAPLPLAPTMLPEAPGRPTHFWVGLGLAAGGAAGAGAFALVASSLVGGYNDQCRGATMAPTSCLTLRTDRQGEIDVFAALTYSSIGLAAVGLGVMLFWPEPAARRRATAVRPLLGLRGAGLEVVW